MQISCDPRSLSKEQREAIAGFILTFPGHGATISHADNPATGASVAAPPIPVPPAPAPLTAAAAFGGVQHPLAPGATAAPSTAAAPASTTAPVVPLVTLGVAPNTSAPAPSAPPSASAAGAVVPPAPSPADDGDEGAGNTAWSPVMRDSRGYAWDESIHSAGKTFLKDGTWRKKKDINPGSVEFVEENQRKSGRWVDPARPGAAAGVPTPPAPAPVPVHPAPASTPVASADPTNIFVELMGRLPAYIQQKRVTSDEINAICQKSGVSHVYELTKFPERIAMVCAEIDNLLATR